MNWILVIASIAAPAFSLYINLREKSRKLKSISWGISVIIWLVTIYGSWEVIKKPQLSLSLIGPHLSAAEGYDLIKRYDDHQDQLQLLEAIGSYYTCVRKRERKREEIFLQFAEWVFVLRSPNSGELIEYRVLDSRLPNFPVLPISALFEGMQEGGFATCVSYNITPTALGIREMSNEDSAVHQYDAKGRVIVKTMGKGLRHSFAEINESPNEFVISLTRACVRSTDHLPESNVIERWNRFGDIVIYRTTYPENSFYEKLVPIEFALDAQEAIKKAEKAGAEFQVPGKQMASIGAVRLLDGRDINVPGPCWHLPMRMSLRPIVVHAITGRVYFVDDNGKYTAYWSIKLYIKQYSGLVVGLLFLIFLGIVVFRTVRLSRLNLVWYRCANKNSWRYNR
jgi:hypothetical protein